ncbi:MAG: ankyrin repeat domain-containing protein [Candidatus Berkelbacteria bacterium]
MSDIFEAILHGYTDEVETYIFLGQDLNLRGPKDVSLLSFAIAAEKEEIALMLLREEVIIDSKDDEGFTPIIYASYNQLNETVNQLIAKGCNVNARTNEGLSALCFACDKENIESAKLLLHAGANPNIIGLNLEKFETAGTPLHLAAMRGNTQLIKLLIEYGANVNLADHDQWTALHFAITYGELEPVKLLVEAGADINKPEGLNQATPLTIALDFHEYQNYDRSDIIEYLKSKNAIEIEPEELLVDIN